MAGYEASDYTRRGLAMRRQITRGGRLRNNLEEPGFTWNKTLSWKIEVSATRGVNCRVSEIYQLALTNCCSLDSLFSFRIVQLIRYRGAGRAGGGHPVRDLCQGWLRGEVWGVGGWEGSGCKAKLLRPSDLIQMKFIQFQLILQIRKLKIRLELQGVCSLSRGARPTSCRVRGAQVRRGRWGQGEGHLLLCN